MKTCPYGFTGQSIELLLTELALQ